MQFKLRNDPAMHSTPGHESKPRRQLVRATVGFVVEVQETHFIDGDDRAPRVRWDYTVTLESRVIDSSCNGTFATAAAAMLAGRKEARQTAFSILHGAKSRVAA